MKIEKHNGHGMQLAVTLKPSEALSLAAKLLETAQKALDTDINTYVSVPCHFEDDNDRYVPTDFSVLVLGDDMRDCQPTYPCGKPVEDGVCNRQAGHEYACYRR